GQNENRMPICLLLDKRGLSLPKQSLKKREKTVNNRVRTPRTLPAKCNRERPEDKLYQRRDTVMIPRRLAAAVAVIALLTFGGCQKKEEPKKPARDNRAKKETATFQAEPAGPQPNPERNAYFGEEHIHTSW